MYLPCLSFLSLSPSFIFFHPSSFRLSSTFYHTYVPTLQSRDVQCPHQLADWRQNAGQPQHCHCVGGEQEGPGGRQGSHFHGSFQICPRKWWGETPCITMGLARDPSGIGWYSTWTHIDLVRKVWVHAACVCVCVCVWCCVYYAAAELSFLETSALTGENVEEVFLKCTRSILSKIDAGQRQSSIYNWNDNLLWQRAKLEVSCSIINTLWYIFSKITRFPIFIYAPVWFLPHSNVNPVCVQGSWILTELAQGSNTAMPNFAESRRSSRVGLVKRRSAANINILL